MVCRREQHVTQKIGVARSTGGSSVMEANDASCGTPRTLMTGEAEAASIDQAEALLPRELIRDDEIIIMLLRPSSLFIVLASLRSIAAILIFTLGFALLVAKVSWLRTGWSEEQVYLLGAALIALRIGWQALEWVNRVYVLTDRRIITRSGVLRVNVYEAPLRRIQHTSVFMRIRERMFGLGTIGFATAGSDVFDTFWVMVRQPFAVHRVVTETIRRYGSPRP